MSSWYAYEIIDSDSSTTAYGAYLDEAERNAAFDADLAASGGWIDYTKGIVEGETLDDALDEVRAGIWVERVWRTTCEYAETFWTPFQQHSDRIGEPFEVFRVIDQADAEHDPEVLPMFAIRFPDGTEIEAWPEEVFVAMIDSGSLDPRRSRAA